MALKIVFGTKDGKCVQKELSDDQASSLQGLKVGETFKGETIDLTGYEFEITGGSDSGGFPMRKDVDGTLKKRILAVSGVGLKQKRKGQRQRKTVAGNTVHEKTAQINVKILKAGKAPLTEAPAAEGGEEAQDAKKE